MTTPASSTASMGPTQRLSTDQPVISTSPALSLQTTTDVTRSPRRRSGRSAIRSKTIAATLAGLVGGTSATMLLSLLNVRYGSYHPITLALLIGGIVGLLIPGLINGISGLLAGQPGRALHSGLLAAGLGAASMMIIALGVSQFVSRETIFFSGNLALGLLAWLLFGSGLGMVEGLVWRSLKRTFLGSLGGATGAVLAFAVGYTLDNEGAFILVGPLVGLGANAVPDILKTAWVRVSNGSKYFDVTLDKPSIVFGSSDNPQTTDVGLYGDRSISPQHFILEQQRDQFNLVRLPQTGPVLVNGMSIQDQVLLQAHDVITVGRAQIEFMIKGDN